MPTDLEETHEAMWPGNIGDLGVIGLVSALNAVGAVTFNSCQGGDGHCIDVPMVAFWAEPSVLDAVCPAASGLGLRLEPVAETAAEDESWGKGGEGIFVLGESLEDLRKMRELALSLVRDFATRKQRELLGELESLEEQAGNATLHYGRQLGPFWKDAE